MPKTTRKIIPTFIICSRCGKSLQKTISAFCGYCRKNDAEIILPDQTLACKDCASKHGIEIIWKISNAVGFDAQGRTIVGHYSSGAKCWKVYCVKNVGGHEIPAQDTIQHFPKKEQAVAYAASLIDKAKTIELAWW